MDDALSVTSVETTQSFITERRGSGLGSNKSDASLASKASVSVSSRMGKAAVNGHHIWERGYHSSEDNSRRHSGFGTCSTLTQPQFGFDPMLDTERHSRGDIPSSCGQPSAAICRPLPPPSRRLSAADLGEKNSSLLEELEHIESEIKEVKAETETCIAGLPAIKEVISETTDFLRVAQIELGHFESEIAKKSAQKQVSRRSSFSSEAKLVEQQIQEHLRLQQLLDKSEADNLRVQQQCQVANHNATVRLDQARFKLRQEIDRYEHEASQHTRALKDQLARENILRATDQQRYKRFRETLESLKLQQVAAQNRNYSADAMHAQEVWQAERKALLRDISHLETHTAEVRAGTAQLERSLADEEENQHRLTAVGQSESAGLLMMNTETHQMQAMIDVLSQKANAAEQEVVELRDQQRAIGKRSMDLIRVEWEECAELQARAKGQVRAPRSLAEDSGLHPEDRVVGEEARVAREQLYEAQSQAHRAERGLREALSELQQQQDTLGYQLHSLQHVPTT